MSSVTPPRLGFIGFGEAAYGFAKDLTAAGLQGIVAYSPSAAKAAPGDAIHTRAAEAGVELMPTARAVCERSSLIVSLTPGSAALKSLRSVRRYLRRGQIYVDASSSAVKDIEKAQALVPEGCAFVDAAVMDPVPLNGIRVLTVASGAAAPDFQALLVPYGMNIQVVSDEPGGASAMKLMRSVCMKGLAALLLESLEGARRYGITDALVADMARFIDERPFADLMKRWVSGTAIHAGRRVHEVTEAMNLLSSLGASTRMTRATRGMLQDIERMGLRERFGGREPETMGPVLDAIIEANDARSTSRTTEA